MVSQVSNLGFGQILSRFLALAGVFVVLSCVGIIYLPAFLPKSMKQRIEKQRLLLGLVSDSYERYVLASGLEPDSLASLVQERYIPVEALTDEFSGRDLHLLSNNGMVRIWSVGPDGVDDAGILPYDPTNGTMSGGDLIVEIWPSEATAFPAAPSPATSTATCDTIGDAR